MKHHPQAPHMLSDATYRAKAEASADLVGLGKSSADRGQFVATTMAVAKAFDRQRVWRAEQDARLSMATEPMPETAKAWGRI